MTDSSITQETNETLDLSHIKNKNTNKHAFSHVCS